MVFLATTLRGSQTILYYTWGLTAARPHATILRPRFRGSFALVLRLSLSASYQPSHSQRRQLRVSEFCHSAYGDGSPGAPLRYHEYERTVNDYLIGHFHGGSCPIHRSSGDSHYRTAILIHVYHHFLHQIAQSERRIRDICQFSVGIKHLINPKLTHHNCRDARLVRPQPLRIVPKRRTHEPCVPTLNINLLPQIIKRPRHGFWRGLRIMFKDGGGDYFT